MCKGAAQATKPVPGVAAQASPAPASPGHQTATLDTAAARRVLSEPGMSAERSAHARSPRAMASRPTPIQRCGIGSSCACPADEKLAGIQRDLRRATSGGGAPVPAGTRVAMERAFAADFGAVRVHTSPEAHQVAAALHARALTAGTDILFHSGAFRPGTADGDRLLAHELAHVVQQTRGLARATLDGGAGDPLEQAAQAASLAADHASPAAEHEAHGAALHAAQGSAIPSLSAQPLSLAHDDLDAGAPPESGARPGPTLVAATPGTPMICSKRLEAPVVGWFANHSYIDDTGGGDCHGNGRVGNYAIQELVSGNFKRGCAKKTDTSTDPQNYTPNAKPCVPKAGVTDVHQCLRDAFNAYANPSEYVNPFGPNSNTFAATLANACCADSSDSGLGWVPGWDHAPAGPCPNPPAAPNTVPAPAPAPGANPAQPPPPPLPAPTSALDIDPEQVPT